MLIQGERCCQIQGKVLMWLYHVMSLLCFACEQFDGCQQPSRSLSVVLCTGFASLHCFCSVMCRYDSVRCIVLAVMTDATSDPQQAPVKIMIFDDTKIHPQAASDSRCANTTAPAPPPSPAAAAAVSSAATGIASAALPQPLVPTPLNAANAAPTTARTAGKHLNAGNLGHAPNPATHAHAQHTHQHTMHANASQGPAEAPQQQQQQAAAAFTSQQSKPDYNALRGHCRGQLQVEHYSTEQELLTAFCEAMRLLDPDIVVGYDVQKGSVGYLADRGNQLDINLLRNASRTPEVGYSTMSHRNRSV